MVLSSGVGWICTLWLFHGRCWETFYIFAYCGLVRNPHLIAFLVCSPSNVNQVSRSGMCCPLADQNGSAPGPGGGGKWPPSSPLAGSHGCGRLQGLSAERAVRPISAWLKIQELDSIWFHLPRCHFGTFI